MKKIASFLLTAFTASVLFAMPIYAEETTVRPAKTVAPEVVTCIQSAIESRDLSVIGAVEAYAATIKMALTVRKDALKAAWSKAKPAEIRTALKDTWAAYKKSLRTARMELRNAKSKAWKQFSTERKACKGGDNIESASPMVDSQL